MLISEADTADILAGRYVDGIWSYPQILKYAEERGVSKSTLDKAIIKWHEALGEKAFLENDISERIGDASMTYLDEAVEIGVQMVSGLLTPASLTDIYVMIARKHKVQPQKVESSIRSAICEINKEMGMHFTPMTYIHIVALGEKYRKKMMKAK